MSKVFCIDQAYQRCFFWIDFIPICSVEPVGRGLRVNNLILLFQKEFRLLMSSILSLGWGDVL